MYILTIDRPATDDWPTSYCKNFNWRYLSNGSSDPLHVLF